MSYRNSNNEHRRPDYVIGRSMYEFSKIDEEWVAAANADCDEIWVPARAVSKVFSSSGVRAEKIFVVPEAIDTFFFDPAAHGSIDLPQGSGRGEGHWCNRVGAANDYKFFSNFKWEPRKGWDILFQAYFTAFDRSDPVVLYILTHIWFSGSPDTYGDRHDASFLIREVELMVARAFGAIGLEEFPRFCFLLEDVPEVRVAQVYKSIDCFVLPTRGEGWGLPVIQAMAMAKPTITTAWGGQLEFLNKDASLMIPIDGVEEIPLNSVYRWRLGKKWAIPSMPHTRRYMEMVFKNRSLGREIGTRAREHVVQHFSEEAITAVVGRRLQRIRRLISARKRMR
jgi:glycosyltransferase involved in cell wall biosynthesis